MACPAHVDRAAGVLDAQHARKHDRVLVELGRLARLDPTGGAFHAGDAQVRGLRVHAADEFLDHLGLVARGGDTGWRLDQCGHDFKTALARRSVVASYGCTLPATTALSSGTRKLMCSSAWRKWSWFHSSTVSLPATGCGTRLVSRPNRSMPTKQRREALLDRRCVLGHQSLGPATWQPKARRKRAFDQKGLYDDRSKPAVIPSHGKSWPVDRAVHGVAQVLEDLAERPVAQLAVRHVGHAMRIIDDCLKAAVADFASPAHASGVNAHGASSIAESGYAVQYIAFRTSPKR